MQQETTKHMHYFPAYTELIVALLSKCKLGSCISVHVLLSLLNEFGKRVKCETCQVFYHLFATSLINLKIQEHEC